MTGHAHPRYGKAGGCDGSPESIGSDGVGWLYEQYPQPGGGNYPARIGICPIRKCAGEHGDRYAPPRFFALFFPPALVNIITVLALGTAKLSIGTAGSENFVTMPTGFQGAVRVRQHKAEHHLQAQQQGVRIPYNRRPVQQGNVVGRRDAPESRHPLPVEVAGHFVQHIIVVVMEKAGIE